MSLDSRQRRVSESFASQLFYSDTTAVPYRCVAPEYDFPLTFWVTYSVGKKKGLRGVFKRSRKDVIEIKLGYDDIVQKIKDLDDRETQDTPQASLTKVHPASAKISVSEGSCTVLLEVVGGDVDDVRSSSM